ncbi:MAG TPA: glycosyltransferase family 4 protein [Candidatus Nanoarchaeia archaeon]|nr:glycosyltransferase family 4 protein [Candidatus Nanoarchaeia archaeon]
MNIGFITTYFYPVLGGAEANCYYLAKELAKRHEVHVFTSTQGNLPEEETIHQIHIHRSKELIRVGYYGAFYPSLLKKILSYELDILHVQSFGFLWHDLCVLLKKAASSHTKLVITAHGPFMALASYPLWKRAVGSVVKILEYLPNSFYDLVIQVNPSQRQWLLRYGFRTSKIRFLPNGVPVSALKRHPTMKDLAGRFIISYIGRVQRYKGLNQVIHILPDLIRKNKKILFVIAGHPEDMHHLVNLSRSLSVGNNVLFLGTITEEDKYSLLATTNVFVFPSKWEAFGISMLEAMSQGCPVISTRTEGGAYLIEEGTNGFLFDYGNTQELKEKILLLMNNKKLATTISKNNAKKAKTYTWEKISQDLEQLYLRIR